jgi:preprotein translocase subunit YajC
MKAKFYVLASTFFLLMNGRLFAEADEAVPPPADQSFWQTLVMIGIAFMFFYVILWRPEQKKRKILEAQRSGLQKGDRVVALGIIGTVVRVGEHTVIIKMYDGSSKIEVYKAAVTDVLPETDDAKGDGKKEKIENIDDES